MQPWGLSIGRQYRERQQMSDKRFYLKFVEADVTGIITLYWDTAPKTCEALWGALEKPFQWKATHAIFSGPEIMMGLAGNASKFRSHRTAAREPDGSARCRRIAVVLPAQELLQDRPGRVLGNRHVLSFRGKVPSGPTGWIPCTYFGKMTENLDGIAEQCRLIRIEGAKTVEMGRLD